MFTFMTLVKVISGFYIGCTGHLVEDRGWILDDNQVSRRMYYVLLECKKDNRTYSESADLLSNQLETVKQ